MKHSQAWYEKVHDYIAGGLVIAFFPALILICGLLENI